MADEDDDNPYTKDYATPYFENLKREMDMKPKVPVRSGYGPDREWDKDEKGHWLVIDEQVHGTLITPRERISRGCWMAECDGCSTLFKVTTREIYNGKYSCGCKPRPRKATVDFSGQEIGRIVVSEYMNGIGWMALCTGCGNEYYVISKPGISYARQFFILGFKQFCMNPKCKYYDKLYRTK